MRVLLDENVPVDLAGELHGHDVTSVQRIGWSGLKNGELLRKMAGRFEVLVSMDRGLVYQQNTTQLPLGIVLIRAPSNRLAHLRPLVPALISALRAIGPGDVKRVGA